MILYIHRPSILNLFYFLHFFCILRLAVLNVCILCNEYTVYYFSVVILTQFSSTNLRRLLRSPTSSTALTSGTGIMRCTSRAVDAWRRHITYL